jgi:hypothetical protein
MLQSLPAFTDQMYNFCEAELTASIQQLLNQVGKIVL